MALQTANKQLQNEMDDVSASMGALCELLAAAEHAQVRASSIHTILKPLLTKLDSAAGTVSDMGHLAAKSA